MDPTKPVGEKLKYIPAVYVESEKQRQQVRESVSIQCREATSWMSQSQRKGEKCRRRRAREKIKNKLIGYIFKWAWRTFSLMFQET